MLGAVGGSAAAFGAMDAWDLIPAAAQESPPSLEGGGNGTRVAVLGAGPAGLTAGYELSQMGYDVRILEASHRVGGHVFTVRGGSRIVEVDGTEQVAEFDEGHYFDAGAWRIPSHHRGTLHYCKEFGIPLTPHKNRNVNAYTYLDELGQRMRHYEWLVDMQGYTSELLAQAVDQNSLDADLTDEDAELLIDYLISAGFLSSEDLSYTGSSRRGYAELPGMGPGVPSEPVPFSELLPFGSRAMQTAGGYMAITAGFTQQETMLEPVGGMSRIYEQGFHPRLTERLDLRAEVIEIRQSEDEVRIVYNDREFDTVKEITADYCVCTIPLSILRQIPADFTQEMSEAIESIPYSDVGKSGLQFSRRFWEEDDWIYGGLTFTDISEIATIHYPDYGYHSEKGVLQGYYNFGDTAAEVGDMSPEERINVALEQGSKIHPQYEEEFENGVSVAWQNMLFAQGGSPGFSQEARDLYYDRLLEPDGRIYLAGAHTTYLTGWQQGAIEAAWTQIQKLHERVAQSSE